MFSHDDTHTDEQWKYCFALNIDSNGYKAGTIDDGDRFLYENSSESSTSSVCEEMNNFLLSFAHQINSLNLSQKNKNTIYNLCENLVDKMKLFNKHLIKDDNGMNSSQVLEMSTDFICSKFSEFDSNYKRQKKFDENELYVAPKAKAIGIHWEMIRDLGTNSAIPKLIQ